MASAVLSMTLEVDVVKKMCSREVIQALMVVMELTISTMSEAAIDVMVEDLAEYPSDMVLKALARCRREVRPGRFCLPELLARIEDGHPGTEEAWGMVSRAADENESVMWTAEMAEAFRSALPMMNEGDMVAARMAFKEAYGAILDDARLQKRLPVWAVSLGRCHNKRHAVLEKAVGMGRITKDHSLTLAGPTHHDDKLAIGMANGVESLQLTYYSPGEVGEGRRRADELAASVVSRTKALGNLFAADTPEKRAAMDATLDSMKADAQAKVDGYLAGQGGVNV